MNLRAFEEAITLFVIFLVRFRDVYVSDSF